LEKRRDGIANRVDLGMGSRHWACDRGTWEGKSIEDVSKESEEGGEISARSGAILLATGPRVSSLREN